jgi:hypothetical protein
VKMTWALPKAALRMNSSRLGLKVKALIIPRWALGEAVAG